jgi:hypothetical protein
MLISIFVLSRVSLPFPVAAADPVAADPKAADPVAVGDPAEAGHSAAAPATPAAAAPATPAAAAPATPAAAPHPAAPDLVGGN